MIETLITSDTIIGNVAQNKTLSSSGVFYNTSVDCSLNGAQVQVL